MSQLGASRGQRPEMLPDEDLPGPIASVARAGKLLQIVEMSGSHGP